MEKLSIKDEVITNDSIISGSFCINGVPKYKINEGIPDFRIPSKLPKSVQETLSYYEKEADIYDKYLPLTFDTFGVDEYEIRNKMVDLLCLKPQDRVLETGCGTGRDSEIIASRLGNGESCIKLSLAMLKQAKRKLDVYENRIGSSFSWRL